MLRFGNLYTSILLLKLSNFCFLFFKINIGIVIQYLSGMLSFNYMLPWAGPFNICFMIIVCYSVCNVHKSPIIAYFFLSIWLWCPLRSVGRLHVLGLWNLEVYRTHFNEKNHLGEKRMISKQKEKT